MKKAYYFDMDGVLANFHKAYKEDKMVALKREAMATLEPFEANVALVRNMMAHGEMVYILTKAANDEAKAGKMEWLAKFIPEMDEAHFICIVGHGKKVDFIREDGILIDDDMKNLRPWAKAGHEVYFVEEKGATVAF